MSEENDREPYEDEMRKFYQQYKNRVLQSIRERDNDE